MSEKFEKISVIGAGAWGTALAQLCARNGVLTKLWAREAAVVEAINQQSENVQFLRGVKLASHLRAVSDLEETADAGAYLLSTPVQHSRQILTTLKTVLPSDSVIAICSKGIETATGLLMPEIVREIFPEARTAMLSGPSFAIDVARDLPTAVTLACADLDIAERLKNTIARPSFRPYLSEDVTGAALGGAVKNVIAIAAGVVEGRGLGDSARAAVIARGFAECQRLGAAMGVQPATLEGLCGLGDLVLTAASHQSRNMSLGLSLGQGRSLAEIVAERNTVAEGVATAQALEKRAAALNVEMPICAAVSSLVSGDQTVDACINALLRRPIGSEAK